MITAPSPYPDIEALEPDRAAVRELAAHIYSAQADLALKVAKLDDDGAWAGDGYPPTWPMPCACAVPITLGGGPPPPASPGTPPTLRGRDALTRDGRPLTGAGWPGSDGHQIGAMTPLALDGWQSPDYGLAIEMLIHNDDLRQARAGPSPP